MKRISIGFSVVLAVLVLILAVGLIRAGTLQRPQRGPQTPLDTGFTYQGQLMKDDAPINGDCEVAFRLYDAASGGDQVGNAITRTLAISNGLLTTNLDFGTGVFTGTARWLGLAVQCPGDASFTTFGERQALTPAPYALYASNADLLDGQHANNFAATAHAHGQPGFIISTLDGAQETGQYNAITIGVDGLPLISYYDATNDTLKVAHCNDIACTTATLTTLDNVGPNELDSAITIGADGLGLISYRDSGANDDLKVAHCSNVECTAATITTLDSTGNVGLFSSVTIGADGLGLISYLDYAVGSCSLKVAHCSNLTCTTATITALETGGDTGHYSSITIGADGLGLISYFIGGGADNLRVAHCSDINCTAATLSTLDSAGSVGDLSSITVGTDGLGLISYRDFTNRDLKVAHCSDITCTTAALATLDSAGYVGDATAISVGADGMGVIGYYDSTNGDVKVAHCSNTACTSATLTTVDAGGDVGRALALTIGADGLPLLSYYLYNTNNDLRVTHCSNVFCIPYFRRR